MFAKKQRYSFKRGIPGKVFSTPYFVIRYEVKDDAMFQCAVVVGKKVDKKAVGRNKIKRIVVQNIKDLVPENTKSNLILYARNKINELTEEKIKEELQKAFKTIQII
jgi:ribonuclease P protein component